eukprot:2032896-Rhodomonas_salina.1
MRDWALVLGKRPRVELAICFAEPPHRSLASRLWPPTCGLPAMCGTESWCREGEGVAGVWTNRVRQHSWEPGEARR